MARTYCIAIFFAFLTATAVAEDCDHEFPSPSPPPVAQFTDAELEKEAIKSQGEFFYRAILGAVKSRVEKGQTDIYGMTDVEKFALDRYIHTSYSIMNDCLRKKMQITACQGYPALAEAVKRALRKLPVYQGEVIRTTDLPASELAKHQTGALVEYPAFTSASSNPAMKYGSETFYIKSKQARDVSGFSNLPGEKEVIFLPGTKFKVTKRSMEVFGLWPARIYLEEQDN